MSKKDDGGPAFPASEFTPYPGGGGRTLEHAGMSLRDHFAAKALPSVVVVCRGDPRANGETPEAYFARMSYSISDAMLAERSKSHD